jgi:molybdopterin-guanine dinucleotide biosynthesis protein A
VNARFAGAAKGLCELGSRRVIDLVVDAVRPVVDELLLITNDPRVSAAVPGVVSHGDVRRERGSLVGLHSALTHCRDAALVIAWDMPFVAPALLAMLRRVGEDKDSAVIPEGPRGPEPFCAYFTRSCLDVVERQIYSGEMRLSACIEALPQRVVLAQAEVERFGPPERIFANINTPRDLAAARLLVDQRGDVELADTRSHR